MAADIRRVSGDYVKPQDFKIRAYVPDDFEALYQIDQVCYPAGIAYTKRMLRWFLRLPGSACLVAVDARDAIAGFILAEHELRDAHIITLDVLPAFRRRKIGRALLHAMESSLTAQGVRRIELETATENAPAVAFWQKCGYRTIAVLPRYYLGRMDAYSMIKNLEPSDKVSEAPSNSSGAQSKLNSEEV